MRYCKNCLFPETKPDLFFNDEGICSACFSADLKETIDWDKRKEDFFSIINRFKKGPDERGYDCLIPVSGGKDSTYQAYFVKEVCGYNCNCSHDFIEGKRRQLTLEIRF